MPLQDHEKRLTSERYADLKDAVDTLYIKNNLGGRNQFSVAWPAAAIYVLGEELSRFDREGAPDKERRAVLEAEAEERRVALLDTLVTLEKKSLLTGTLQVEYVQGVVLQLGRPLALEVYARWLVDRFIAPSPEELPPPEVESVKIGDVVVEARAPVPPRRPPVRQNTMDHIRPISVEPPPQAPDEGLITGTQGGVEIHAPAAPAQESLAPVLGGQKTGGLRIMSIADKPAPAQDEKQGS
ncbi:MAG: hypothetical protein WBK55_08785 [Alphaproteobacteria bacterium]